MNSPTRVAPFLRPITDAVKGGHFHRSGWPYVMQSIASLFSENAEVIFDDFLEKTIFNQRVPNLQRVHRSPWIGVCHYPHDTPDWYDTEHLRELPSQAAWAESRGNLRLCVTFGSNLASWVADNWNVPSICLRHPTEVPEATWSRQRFFENKMPYLLQVGWYLRNTQAIFQIVAPHFLSKAWLRSPRGIADKNHALCSTYFHPGRPPVGSVRELKAVSNFAYDALLSENVVFVELIAAVANNTVVECIARNTPIVINRHPSPVEYLGAEYPLFYDNIEEIPYIVTMDNIMAAHNYLKMMDKAWLPGNAFRDSLTRSCRELVPELRWV